MRARSTHGFTALMFAANNGQGNVVNDYDYVIRRNLKHMADGLNRFAGEIHVGHRAGKYYALSLDEADRHDRLVLPLIDDDRVAGCELLDGLEAHVVPCAFVLRARIA